MRRRNRWEAVSVTSVSEPLPVNEFITLPEIPEGERKATLAQNCGRPPASLAPDSVDTGPTPRKIKERMLLRETDKRTVSSYWPKARGLGNQQYAKLVTVS